ncbi:hypothetical protein PC9H_011047 [Pleurotus ostreatus]|uniref:Uncharacterized protein n=2 Tax=Pleurotus TaxID=5320 RepID=A0A8H6ZPV4_PLEOS|nr:uncharacterized protein PC9H_011047 [Pleurotus ostreatus]KAF7422883.1 hypothetical protein PC9H_011047 [Pleurotus ostreatus]KAG9227268.1 hypothetical protein CCMSSC00406_0004193 [Pleurotus cornucopiae]KAJ8691151.1 hypothetical protein PTI98_010748 [Pleurotus ostreatus]
MSDIDYNSLDLSFIQVSFDDGILVIVNKVNARNTFVASLIPELVQALEYADKDDRVRVVIFTADHTAPAYCSGANLSDAWHWNGIDPDTIADHDYRDAAGQVSLAVLRCRKITIAAINGNAVGAGATALQLPFDFRVAWGGAKIAFPFASRAVSPEGATSFLLPRLLGYSAATALLLSGQIFLPTHPLLNRLYFTILPKREDVLPAALTFARELASSTSAPSIVATKALLLHAPSSAEDAHIIESYLFKKMITGNRHDLVEGTQSFKERRSAVFTDTVDHMKEWAPWWTSLNEAPRAAKL